MTLPSPNNNPGGVGAPQVPTLPDGTPNFPGGVVIAGTSGKTSIWNLPSEVSGQTIWFGIGHKTTHDEAVDMRTHQVRNLGGPTSYRIMKSPEAVMRQFAAMSFNNPQEFFALQKALASGPWGTVNPTGAFDANTEKALGNAMLQYLKVSKGAGVGVSFTDYLLQTGAVAQSLGGKGTSAGSGQGGGGGGTINLTDPAQIRDAAQNAAQQALGQGLTEDQLNKFVAQFQAQQVQNQSDPYTTSTKLPAEAMAYAQQVDPQAYQDNKRQAFLNSLVNLLGGSATGRPNMTPVPSVGS